jgi:transposase
VVGEKGYHSGAALVNLQSAEVRTYIPEKQPGHRHWEGKAEEQQAVYANRRRVKGAYGKRLVWKRGELNRAEFCALLRYGRNALDASARTREHTQATIDSCRRV